MQDSLVSEVVSIHYKKLKIDLNAIKKSVFNKQPKKKVYEIFGGELKEHIQAASIVIEQLNEIRKYN